MAAPAALGFIVQRTTNGWDVRQDGDVKKFFVVDTLYCVVCSSAHCNHVGAVGARIGWEINADIKRKDF